jgi:uncharacterized phage protein gp47/JayE
MTDLSDLIEAESADDLEETALALAQGNELPVESWGSGGTWRTMMEFVAAALADASFARVAIARGYVLALSAGAWIDRVLQSQFDDERVAATFTYGTFVYTDNGGGPHTIAVGAIVEDVSGLRFTVLVGDTCPLSGSVDILVKAAIVGAAYNIPNNATLATVTSYPTVAVTNPEIGTTGTWITSLGADEESDAAAQKRAPLKWATLSTGSPPSAYLFWALSWTGVTRATVDEGNPDGPNTVRIYVDNAGVVAALQVFIDTKKPSGTAVAVMAATTQSVTVPAVVTVERAKHDAAVAAVTAVLVTLAEETDIGGIVRQAELTERIMAVDGIVDVVFASSWAGTPNIQLGTTAIVQFAESLTYVDL